MHSERQPGSLDAGDPDDCPIRNVLDRIGDQWSLLILLTLVQGTHRFSEFQRAIGDITKRVLADTLRKLERDGFVSRKVYATVRRKWSIDSCRWGSRWRPNSDP